jgi:uncharacterized protein (UPF0332 family)
VSPRSAEYLARAHEGLASARTLVDGGHAAVAVSTAYYAMLNAARAALSERGREARSHRGIWNVFREELVLRAGFDADLFAAAQAAQPRREASDYGAETFEIAEARELLSTAERFVAAVEASTP